MQIFTYQPPTIPWLDLRYVDRDIIIINKPSGLLSNPGIADYTHDCALSRIQQRFKDAILVHRLDCSTSGVMVFARNKKAESNLKTQFQDRKTQKTYITEVSGHLQNAQGVIELPITADKANPPKQQVSATGKVAITHFETLEVRANSTLLELKPVTGRTHQLRVHLLAIGNPILGDDFYAEQHIVDSAPRLKLHAQSLSFTHPYSGKQMHFSSHCSF
ncbi:Pseudouridylate synthase [Shewanella piezotolerans WP3]|uniref:Dual-specificity RNA pseudouridine synthase RluA n=1 Tax=Shewanella piezotolerans (strain WP3 / JCM 13877) TaxID=225849 RepID=B8CLC1_SHEPW|nr:pseudouridine synthase [Shewanella piezotolerans]ACJ28447.1 Pseudouridylate synthase [Shewanella piezotolerans WP3]